MCVLLLVGCTVLVGRGRWCPADGGRSASSSPCTTPRCPSWRCGPGTSSPPTGCRPSWTGRPLFVGFLLGGGAHRLRSALGGPLRGCRCLGLLAALLTSRAGHLAIARPTASGERRARRDSAGRSRASLALRGNWGALALLVLLGCTFLVDGCERALTLTFNAEVLGSGTPRPACWPAPTGSGWRSVGRLQAGLAHRGGSPPWSSPARLLLGGLLAGGGLRRGIGPGRRDAGARGDGRLPDRRARPDAAPAQHGQPRPGPGPRRPGGRPDERAGGRARWSRRSRSPSSGRAGVHPDRPARHRRPGWPPSPRCARWRRRPRSASARSSCCPGCPS